MSARGQTVCSPVLLSDNSTTKLTITGIPNVTGILGLSSEPAYPPVLSGIIVITDVSSMEDLALYEIAEINFLASRPVHFGV